MYNEDKKKNQAAAGTVGNTAQTYQSGTAGNTAQTSQAGTAGGFTSPWGTQADSLLNQYQSRKPFSFDVNQDALYQQYKDNYIRNGKLAMEDTMGQAAALTGGYANSYAKTAGQQTYNRYLEGLNDVVPELYQAALDRYTQEGNDLLTQYQLMMDRDNQDYSRYLSDRDFAQAQVEMMLQMGVRPSDDLIARSGLSAEYVDAFFPKGGGGSGGSSGGRSGKRSGGVDVEAEYLAMKQNGASTRETDAYLKGAIAVGLIDSRAATDLRDKRY